MARTNSEIITQALRKLNVINEVQTASGEQANKGLVLLNQMMEEWREDGLDWGWVKATALSDNAAIPDYAENAVVHGLAVFAAPEFSAEPSQLVVGIAQRAMNILKRKAISEGLETIDNSHLPAGTGRLGAGYDINTDNT